MTLTRFVAFLSIVTIALHVIPGRAQADSAGDVAARCNALKAMDFSAVPDAPTQITQAKLVERQGTAPSYCEVQGQVAPQVGIEMRLPEENWNGKFLMVGCGAMCGGFFTTACEMPLQSGYACIATDMGHKGEGNVFKGLWAYNNLQAEVDFAYRATHVAALAGKAITEGYYRAAPKRAYYMGCSQGGRQGLVEAQRFPWDFDGIIAGAPPIPYDGAFMNLLQVGVLLAPGGGGGPALTLPAVQLMHEAALAKCDLDDGVKDGIIGNPPACKFDPSELVCRSGNKAGCLTEIQAETAKKLYGGVRTSTGEALHPGYPVGSEIRWTNTDVVNPDNWFRWEFVKELAVEGFRYKMFSPDPGPSWQPADFDVDRDYKRLGMMESLFSVSNPDLRRFKAAGGKLIVYHGWNDEWIVPQPVIDYYETVERTMGGRKKTQDFFRLFMLPGVDHCWGGRGADAVDFLGVLEGWVERGQAPDRVLGAHIDGEPGSYPYRQFPSDPRKARFTRPVYSYPQRAVYKGTGDSNDAANFRPVER